MTRPARRARTVLRTIPLTLGAAASVLVGLARAASPTFWHVSSQADLLRGDLEHLSSTISDGSRWLHDQMSCTSQRPQSSGRLRVPRRAASGSAQETKDASTTLRATARRPSSSTRRNRRSTRLCRARRAASTLGRVPTAASTPWSLTVPQRSSSILKKPIFGRWSSGRAARCSPRPGQRASFTVSPRTAPGALLRHQGDARAVTLVRA